MQVAVQMLVVGILKILVLTLQALVHQFSRHVRREPKVLTQRS
jgi:hypothetical protein